MLHYLWDPIGISDVPEARDEYHTYCEQVYKLINENVDIETLATYLYDIEKDSMGLTPSDMSKCSEIAGIIIDWRDLLRKQ